ncbi:MAG: hypothetical protein GW855_11685 [Erythrobacter sp.]|nr:hypothetical protein [Erythrobacter sp.]NCQ63080.1 hypothetical protein [Alphaproteobacteria bacterium]
MTALSLTAHFAKTPAPAGLPLEGLPPFEAGRTVPAAFAEILSKAGKAGPDAPGDGEIAPEITPQIEGEEPGEGANALVGEPADLPVLPGLGARAEAVAGMAATAAAAPAASAPAPAHPATEAPELTTERPASGKVLPSPRPELAAPALPGTPGRVAAPDAPAVAPADGRADAKTDAKLDAGATPAAVGKPADPARLETLLDTKGPAEARALAPTRLPQIGSIAQGPGAIVASSAAVAQVATRSDLAARPVSAPNIAAPSATPHAALANAIQPGESGQLAGGDPSGAENAARGQSRGQAEGEAGTRQANAPQIQSQLQASLPAAGRAQPEAAQAGLQLQVRAAERPMAAPEPAPSLTQAGASLSSAPGVVAPLHMPGAGTVPLTAAVQPTAQPHFPELAALVDRIAAARDSVGSASATIAVAHKELGNLSLTFETTGRTLDVEVAAQDSDTQRSLAAALAADRPQLRAADAQAPAQTLHSQLASSAHGGGGDARQSAMAGDARSDRQDQGRGNARDNGGQGGTQRGGNRHDPKSDGGIYA